jgi:hypothetical protein
MRQIEERKVKTRQEADAILQEIEPVSRLSSSRPCYNGLQVDAEQRARDIGSLHPRLPPDESRPLGQWAAPAVPGAASHSRRRHTRHWGLPLRAWDSKVGRRGVVRQGCSIKVSSFLFLFVELCPRGCLPRYINARNVGLASQYFPAMKLIELDAGHWGE